MAAINNHVILATKRQRGEINLLGLGLSLLVVALLGLYAYSDYAENKADTTMQAEVTIWTKVFGKANQYYTTSLDYSGATTQNLINNGIFPTNMVNGSQVRNKYQGAVTAAPATLVDTNDALAFTSQKYDTDGCRGVGAKLAPGLRKLDVNGTVVKPDGGSLDLNALGTACTAGGASNTLVFTLGK